MYHATLRVIEVAMECRIFMLSVLRGHVTVPALMAAKVVMNSIRWAIVTTCDNWPMEDMIGLSNTLVATVCLQ